MADWATNAWESVKGAASGVGGWFASLFGWGSQDEAAATEAESAAGEAGSQAKDNLVAAFGGADTEVAQVFESMLTLSSASIEAINEMLVLLGTNTSALGVGMQTSLSMAQENISSSLEEIGTSMNETAQTVESAAKDIASALFSAETAGVASAKALATGIKNALSSLPSQVGTVFSNLTSDMKTKFTSAATTVVSQIEKIKTAIKSIPTKVTVDVGANKAFSMGGVVNKETHATIGEDGKEYVIPVTKPSRALALMRQAADDLGINVQTGREAARALGGDPMRSFTPAYAAASNVNTSTVTNNTTVSAPATINVTGTDPRAIASNVARQQERLVLRNIKSAIA